ncbi:hypothetical protein ACFC1R_34105 [Kitasatospora sp. NPDC056138]|uniref:hypothetical protein n=1 Tax=Kitasatospora sp. NPDC056138 TaxID=3345724 RepID=UPI0035E3B067
MSDSDLDPLAEYRGVAERRRRRLPDPRRAVLAHVASSACIAAVAVTLLMCARRP